MAMIKGNTNWFLKKGMIIGGKSMRNKVFLLIKIMITLASLLGVLFFSDSIGADMSIKLPCSKGILYDISVGILSSMFLVWGIDEISQHIQDRQSRKKRDYSD